MVWFCACIHGGPDFYGSEGVEIARAVERDLAMNQIDMSCIEEELMDAKQQKALQQSQELARRQFVDSRVYELMQKRHWCRFKELPVQHVSSFTFYGIFGDFLLGRRWISFKATASDNSIECAIDDKTKCGCYFQNFVSKHTFGSSKGGVYISRQWTRDTQISGGLNYNDWWSLAFSSKTRISDYFWGTFHMNVGPHSLIPSFGGALHKQYGRRHNFEITTIPHFGCKYTHVDKYENIKLYMQLAMSQMDAAALLKLKYTSLPLCNLGMLFKSSVVYGASVEAYCRKLLPLDFAGKFKIESRLLLDNRGLTLVLKLVINNSRINIPIQIVTSESSVFWGCTLVACSAILPTLAIHMFIGDCQFPQDDELVEPTTTIETNDLRHAFYLTFPHSMDDVIPPMENRHVLYFNQGQQIGADASSRVDSGSIEKAQQENEHLVHAASMNFNESNLVIYIALYGSLELVNVDRIVSEYRQGVTSGCGFKDWSEILGLHAKVAKCCNEPLDKVQVINVTNALMSMVCFC
ncbi:hypothetical protein BdWA1_002671 [Babesia duncani]|uniref:Uncharacterized protein n=1 Tax=Babesia duncani TaxID=323732 RepID=A0AAD9PJN9_9APIC|nr:hypothetical protein BdWA1_002671 [Babesia duncani]